MAEPDAYEPRSSQPYLQSTAQYERDLSLWTTRADRIDKIYASLMSLSGISRLVASTFADQEFDLFWASMEVVKPSIYSRPPVPVVTPKFGDRSPVKRVTADLLERAAISGFEATDIDEALIEVRDDLVLSNRGVLWVSYEDDGEGGEKVCVEPVYRDDFAHGPGRRWSEVPWVQRRAWLTQEEMRERFQSKSGDLYLKANYAARVEGEVIADAHAGKAGVWERWDRVENKVTWFTDGCEQILDQDEPHLKLKGKFPCPRPAYGTRRPHSLEPVPDMVRIENQLDTINTLTLRIHDLCDKLVVKGIIPAGTDVGDALESAYRDDTASHMLIPVPSMSLSSGGALVEWLPIDQVAEAILAAVEARRELIGNVQELLGIADIMRGDSDARETATAQEMKAEFGSVRIRDRVNEMVRIARDALCIMSEIMAEEFDLDTLLKMAQMELPTEAEVKRELKELEKAARQELEAVATKAEEVMAGGPVEDPQAAQQQLQQAQQQVIAKFAPMIDKLSKSVTREAVQSLLDDTKTDPFIFDIETNSTVYPNEMAAKKASAEMFSALGAALPIVQGLIQTGGAKLAGELLKDGLNPYRPGRSTIMAIDEYIESMESAPPAGDGGVAELAAAEMEKAKAQMAKVEADSRLKEAELQQRMAQMQGEFQEKAVKLQLENQKLQLQANKQEQEFAAKMADMDAKQNLMQAQTAEILAKIGLDVRKQDLEEYRAATETAFRAEDQARAAEGQAFDQARAVSEEGRAERQQSFTERQSLAERQATEKPNDR